MDPFSEYPVMTSSAKPITGQLKQPRRARGQRARAISSLLEQPRLAMWRLISGTIPCLQKVLRSTNNLNICTEGHGTSTGSEPFCPTMDHTSQRSAGCLVPSGCRAAAFLHQTIKPSNMSHSARCCCVRPEVSACSYRSCIALASLQGHVTL